MRRNQLPATGIGTERWTSGSDGVSRAVAPAYPRPPSAGRIIPPLAIGCRAIASAPSDLDQHSFETLAAGHETSAPDLDLEDIIERPHLAHAHLGAGDQADLLPPRHAAPVGILDLPHRGASAALERRERAKRAASHPAARVGNGMTVRILMRVTHQPVDRREHPLADVVLQHLGVLMRLRPVEPE